MLEVYGEICALQLSGKGRKLAAFWDAVMDLGSEGAGSQQGDRLTWDPGEGRVNLVCRSDVRDLEGTMRLDPLLETYHDQLRLENASELDCYDY